MTEYTTMLKISCRPT